jgi:hypothetical protein
MRLAEPLWLLMLALALTPWLPGARPPSMVYSSLALFADVRARSWRQRLLWLPTALRSLWLAALAVAAARPQTFAAEAAAPPTAPRCLAICLDVSGSMGKIGEDQTDVRASRLERMKRALLAWLDGPRPSTSEIAVVTFSVAPKVLCPPTSDLSFARQAISDAAFDLEDGRTDLGAALATCVELVKDRTDRAQAILLVTDGAQRVPDALGPLAGARIAEAFGTPIFAVNAAGRAADPADLATLQSVCDLTGGSVLRDVRALDSQWDHEEGSEPVPTAASGTWHDRFPMLILVALAVWGLETLLVRTWLRVAPA